MPKYLFRIRYDSTGAQAIIDKGGTARVDMARQLSESLDGIRRSDCFRVRGGASSGGAFGAASVKWPPVRRHGFRAVVEPPATECLRNAVPGPDGPQATSLGPAVLRQLPQMQIEDGDFDLPWPTEPDVPDGVLDDGGRGRTCSRDHRRQHGRCRAPASDPAAASTPRFGISSNRFDLVGGSPGDQSPWYSRSRSTISTSCRSAASTSRSSSKVEPTSSNRAPSPRGPSWCRASTSRSR